MTTEETRSSVDEIHALRRQATWWRWGATLAILGLVAWSVISLKNSVQALAQEGPQQEVFVTQLQKGMEESVVPLLEETAGQTLTEIRPDVEREFMKLNERVPEITEASMKELETLQKTLPERGEQVLHNTFGRAIESREAKLREMFPDATEEQVRAVLQNLAEKGAQRAASANNRLFGPHIQAMQGIVKHMTAIQHSEKPNVKGEHANWEMALIVLDLVREDLKALQPKAAAPAKADKGGKDKAKAKGLKADLRKALQEVQG